MMFNLLYQKCLSTLQEILRKNVKWQLSNFPSTVFDMEYVGSHSIGHKCVQKHDVTECKLGSYFVEALHV